MSAERAFLVLGCVLMFLGVAAGAFGAHALRAKLSPERLATFETGVRYHLWHALGLFLVVAVGALDLVRSSPAVGLSVIEGHMRWPAVAAGWVFAAGVMLFSGSLYVLALTGKREWGAITPLGGVCFLVGWLLLALAAATA